MFPGILLPCCLVVVISGLGLSLSGSPVQTKSEPQGPTRTFSLKYQENSSIATRLDLGQQEVRFRKEPAFGKNDKIARQALRFGPGPDDYVGFAVNLTTRMLYLDINRNLDLTDDLQGVYRSVTVNAKSPVSFFRGVRLPLHNDSGERVYLLEPFYYYGANSGYVAIRSCYRGEVELGGKRWALQIQDNLDGRFDAHDQFMLMPVPGGGEPKVLPYSATPVPRRMFLNGKEYQLEIVRDRSGSTANITFAECSSPIAELTLEARFVRRLVLSQGSERLVILDNPESSVRLPAGDYRIQASYLQVASGKPVLVGSPGKSRLTVTAGAVSTVRVGAPFVSSVTAVRQANSLVLSYVLRGAAGETYSISNPDRGNPPKFVIYRGDKEVAHGSFQFG